MPWLRIDDGFASHPKIAALSDKELRIWLRVLCYCARYPTVTGHVTLASRSEISGFDRKAVRKFVDTRLLDVVEPGLWEVHDWRNYNPEDRTAAERAKRYRERNKDGASRERHGERHAENRDANGASRAGTRARPVPSPTPEGRERPLGATPTEEAQYDSPASSAMPSGTSSADPGNGRKPVSEVTAAKVKRYRRDRAEQWVRNAGYLEPHPAEAIRAEFPGIPAADLIELADLAADLARAHNHEGATTP
jgi:hypothetical protein